MIQPSRKYEVKSYRYSINGQEKEREINENITTALFWEYDSRIGRRWNLDPKPITGMSEYSTFAGNPILYPDHHGDTLGIPGTGEAPRAQTERDVLSLLINPNNSRFINFGDANNGNIVTLVGDKADINRARNNDKGFELLYDMITHSKWMFYTADETSPSKEKDLITGAEGRTTTSDLKLDYPVGSVISHDATIQLVVNSRGQNVELSHINKVISNLAMTRTGEETGTTQTVPSRTYVSAGVRKRYDGYVAIAPGEFYNMNGQVRVTVSRASMVYHELRENYLRVNGYLYNDAHDGSNDYERNKVGGTYGNPNPGVTPKFFNFIK